MWLPQNVRRQKPLVHCLTNMVAAQLTANTLLAIEASPAMVCAPEETEEFAGRADALLVNLGMLDSQKLAAIFLAVKGANETGKPWILDPLTAGLSFRLDAAKKLVMQKPAVIRGNASEIIVLAEAIQHSDICEDFGKIKGTESTRTPEEAIDAGKYIAKTCHCVVGISGKQNYVLDETRLLKINGGHRYMERIAGIGCALNAVIAAYTATCHDAFIGTVGAIQLFSYAAKQASPIGGGWPSIDWGPASFGINFLNALNLIISLPPINKN